jgi:hypothetical protein
MDLSSQLMEGLSGRITIQANLGKKHEILPEKQVKQKRLGTWVQVVEHLLRCKVPEFKL